MACLNKEICVKCINKYRVQHLFIASQEMDQLKEFLWNSLDDEAWQLNSVVLCRESTMRSSSQYQHIDRLSPEWCPYFLEHLVLSKENLKNET